MSYKGKPCGPLKSAKNPDAYTKEELVALAVKRLKVEEAKAKSMTKSTICKSLVAGKLVERTTPVKARPKAKVSSAKPKTAVKKPKATAVKTTKAKATAVKTVVKKASVKPKATAVKTAKAKAAKVVAKKSKTKTPVVITPVSESPKIPKPKVKVTVKKPCIEQSKLPLREHQIRVVNHMRKNRGLIACHDVGSGKTLTAVTAGQCFLEDCAAKGLKGKIIVVTPVSLQDNFKKEMKAYGVDKASQARYEFYTLQKFATEYNKKACGGDKTKPVMLIIDEAHNLRTKIPTKPKKKATAKKTPVVRSDVAVRCAQTAEKVLLLTATAVYNNPMDLTNLVAMVKGAAPLTKREFEKMENDPDAFDRFFSCVISFYEVPKNTEDYPTVTESYAEIPMSKKYYDEYRKVEQRNSHLFSDKNPFRFLTGVRQASNALEECIKCDWVISRARSGRKMVIYSAFKTYGVEKMQEMFDAEGIKYVEITGEIKKTDRTKAVDKYNSGETNVLFITKAGGEGLDLKETREVIIFESSWNRATESQVIGRAVRFRSHASLPKAERHVDVYHVLMVKPEGIDKAIEYASADTMLKDLTEEKDVQNSAFVKRLIPLSIEQRSSC